MLLRRLRCIRVQIQRLQSIKQLLINLKQILGECILLLLLLQLITNALQLTHCGIRRAATGSRWCWGRQLRLMLLLLLLLGGGCGRRLLLLQALQVL